MSKLDEISKQVEELRKSLHDLIDQKGSLTDPEVVAVSQILDAVLNKYSEIIKKNMDK